LRWAAGGLLAAYVLLALYVLWRAAVLSPFSDEFDWIGRWYQLRQDHRWTDYLLAPHNINRLAWTRLAVALDMGVFGGVNAVLILSGAAALGVMAAVLGVQAARAAPPPLKLASGALAAMLTLMAGNLLDASIPINVTYTHAAVFAVLAIVLAEGAPAAGVSWRKGAAAVCAIAAAFGSGAGLALWPVMAWGAFRRRDWSWLAVVLVAGAGFVGLYFAGQPRGAGATTGAALHDPQSAAILALSFLTLPWTRVALDIAWIGGALVGAVAVALVLLRGGREASPAERVACGLILFSLGAAAMAGLGRSGVEEPHNVPLRYGLLVAPMQVGLVMLAAPWATRLARRAPGRLESVALILLLAMFAQNAAMAVKVVQASDVIRNEITAFHAGARRPDMLTLVHPNLAMAELLSMRLRHDGLAQHELHLKPAALSPASPTQETKR
jgi:hypothetical protein